MGSGYNFQLASHLWIMVVMSVVFQSLFAMLVRSVLSIHLSEAKLGLAMVWVYFLKSDWSQVLLRDEPRKLHTAFWSYFPELVLPGLPDIFSLPRAPLFVPAPSKLMFYFSLLLLTFHNYNHVQDKSGIYLCCVPFFGVPALQWAGRWKLRCLKKSQILKFLFSQIYSYM